MGLLLSFRRPHGGITSKPQSGAMRTILSMWDRCARIRAGAFLLTCCATLGLAQSMPLPQWKLANFTSAQLANGTSDDNTDANGDGTVNLIAYASGLTPFQSAGASLPTSSIVSSRLRLSFLRVTAAPDIAYFPEVSSDLRIWTADTSIVSVTPLSGGMERVLVQDSVSAATRRFIRLRVTRTVFDSNGDGLLDDWQLRYFGSIAGTGNGAPLADPEPDGFTNIEESAVGTNPTTAAAPNSEAVLGLTVWTTLR